MTFLKELFDSLEGFEVVWEDEEGNTKKEIFKTLEERNLAITRAEDLERARTHSDY